MEDQDWQDSAVTLRDGTEIVTNVKVISGILTVTVSVGTRILTTGEFSAESLTGYTAEMRGEGK